MLAVGLSLDLSEIGYVTFGVVLQRKSGALAEVGVTGVSSLPIYEASLETHIDLKLIVDDGAS